MNEIDLKQMCQCPQLFVANYFVDLRNQVDKIFARKQIDENYVNDEAWTKMINRINVFEQECHKNANKSKQILNELNSSDQSEKAFKLLFQNKTIMFINFNESSSAKDFKLIIINDDIIGSQAKYNLNVKCIYSI